LLSADQDHTSSDISQASPSSRPGASRWWLGVVVGSAISLPVGWVLSYAASLPFFLGLFFFVLFGLIVGAVIHRIAASGGPYERWAVIIGTTWLVALGFGVSLMVEGSDLPSDLAADVVSDHRLQLGGQTKEEFSAAVAGRIRQILRERYWPGGIPGYVRWILADAEFKSGDIPGVSRTLRRSPSGLWWSARVALSIGLLAFGVASQTLPLRQRAPAVSAMDDELLAQN